MHGEEQALHVDVECFIEVGFGDLAERGELAAAGVGEEDVEAAFLLLDRGEELVEIREVRNIALHAQRIRAKFLHSGVQFRLAPTGDEGDEARLQR